MERNAEEMLDWLRGRDIEQPAGGMIENYVDHYALAHEPIPAEAAPVFERFLESSILDSRSAALSALVSSLERYCYAADALLLHFQDRGRLDTTEYAGLGFLYEMANGGEASAIRIAKLLYDDPYVKNIELRS